MIKTKNILLLLFATNLPDMTQIKEHTEKAKRWIKPTNIEYDTFLKGITEAEKGPFYSVQESMKRFENWLKNRQKK
jgi:hypothetical protein